MNSLLERAGKLFTSNLDPQLNFLLLLLLHLFQVLILSSSFLSGTKCKADVFSLSSYLEKAVFILLEKKKVIFPYLQLYLFMVLLNILKTHLFFLSCTIVSFKTGMCTGCCSES